MRSCSDRLPGVLTGSVQVVWSADLYYDNTRILVGLPVTDVRFTEDATAQVNVSGSFTIVWQDLFGRSMTPQQISDMLAPFGAEIRLNAIVRAGKYQERVLMGTCPITAIPSGVDQTMLFRGRTVVTSSLIDVEFKDRLGTAEFASNFPVPTGPSQLSSAWLELQRLTGFPIARNVPDAALTGSIAYEGSKLDAVYQVSKVLGGKPHLLSDGTLSIRPDQAGPVVAELTRATEIISVGHSMVTSATYNRVVVTSPDTTNQVVLATADVTTGPLRTRNPDGSRSPYGVVPYETSVPSITTAAAAQAYADSLLPTVSTLRAVRVPVTERSNPLRERGDTVTIERPTRVLTGRVLSIDRSGRDTQDLVVEVQGG